MIKIKKWQSTNIYSNMRNNNISQPGNKYGCYNKPVFVITKNLNTIINYVTKKCSGLGYYNNTMGRSS